MTMPFVRYNNPRAREDDVVHVFTAFPTDINDATRHRLHAVCNKAERDKADRFFFARDRAAYLCAHGLLRWALSRCDPSVMPEAWLFEREPLGRLLVAVSHASNLAISLTHCATHVACVIAFGCRCGIDVEPLDRAFDYLSAAEGTIGRDECDWIEAAPAVGRCERFLHLWTLKEAITKAAGRGLHARFDEIALDLRGAPSIARLPPDCTGEWQLWQQLTRGHVEAIAVDSSGLGGRGKVIRYQVDTSWPDPLK